jgi:periplasmic copper chaperone A
MKTLSILFAGALALIATAAAAQEFKVGSLEIGQPWARATPKGATIGGGYLKITNKGAEPDRLVGGSSPVAGRFEIHEMTMVDGVMKMRPLANGLEIKPGQTLELKPGGLHVMLVGLKQPLEAGQTVKGTLVFEKAGTVEIEYKVEPIGASPKAEGAGQGGHGGMKH